MGKTTDEIETHIDHTREDLKANLQELESRVKSAADWRYYFRKHPGAMIGAALVGGALLAVLAGKRGSTGLDAALKALQAAIPSRELH